MIISIIIFLIATIIFTVDTIVYIKTPYKKRILWKYGLWPCGGAIYYSFFEKINEGSRK
jgi:hypothetical protein